jgi:hypothetical protein
MKILKIILMVIAGLILLFLIGALFFPSEYQVKETIAINASDSLVWAQISDFKNRHKWDPWSNIDPGATSTVSDPSNGVGAVYSWQGEKIGSGTLTFLEVEKYRMIKSKLLFITPYEGEADVTWSMQSDGEAVEVTWAVQGDLAYPVERYMASMIDEQLHHSFAQGLNNLKEVCEIQKKTQM